MNPTINILIFFTILNGLLFSFYGSTFALMPYMQNTISTDASGKIIDAGNFTVAAQQSNSLYQDTIPGTGFSLFNVVKTVWNIIALVFNFSSMPVAVLSKLFLGLPDVLTLVISIPITIIYIVSLIRLVFTGG